MASERVRDPVPTSELERRWSAVRAAMAEARLEVLLVAGSSEIMGGYVRWLTDLPCSALGTTVLFPREDSMTVITHGGAGGSLEPAVGDEVYRGVGLVLTEPYFPSIAYTAHYAAAHVTRLLGAQHGVRVGLLGAAGMSFEFGRHVTHELPQATFVDASELIDPIKAVKSGAEWELIRRCAALQDAAMERVFDAIQPGQRECDITALARLACEELGADGGVYLCGSAPPGEPVALAPLHYQNRVIDEGDVVALLIESDGPGGFYTELGRMCVLGEVPERLDEEFSFALAAQRMTVELLRPGAAPAEVWDAYNAYMREHGRPQERRLHSHGQGHDFVERPLIRFDEKLVIAGEMNLACHPTYDHGGATAFLCDNFRVPGTGAAERLHAFPQEISRR